MATHLPKPPKNNCYECGKPGEDLQRCSRCRTVPYCSKECQKADWKSHKAMCVQYMMENGLDYTGTNFGEKGRKKKGKEDRRSRGDIIRDLSQLAQEHNGDTFTVVCWHAMNLVKNLSKAKTHFFAMTLSRNFSSTNPRTFYTLIDAEVLPLTVLEKKFSNTEVASASAEVQDAGIMPGTTGAPLEMLKNDAERRIKNDGALGSVMVVSVELSDNEKNKSVEQAVLDTMCPAFQPLGLFKVHKDTFSKLPPFSKQMWKGCLKNSLDGYAYAMSRQPLPQRY